MDYLNYFIGKEAKFPKSRTEVKKTQIWNFKILLSTLEFPSNGGGVMVVVLRTQHNTIPQESKLAFSRPFALFYLPCKNFRFNWFFLVILYLSHLFCIWKQNVGCTLNLLGWNIARYSANQQKRKEIDLKKK